jgi:hypothetical protein
MPDSQPFPDHSERQPDLMAALSKSLDRPTWVIHLAKHAGPLSHRSETWVGLADDRDAANVAALAWVRDPRYSVSYADGPFVPLRERDRLRERVAELEAELASERSRRAEVEALRELYTEENNERAKAQAEVVNLRAGISWARGMLSDETPHALVDMFLGALLGGPPLTSDEMQAAPKETT